MRVRVPRREHKGKRFGRESSIREIDRAARFPPSSRIYSRELISANPCSGLLRSRERHEPRYKWSLLLWTNAQITRSFFLKRRGFWISRGRGHARRDVNLGAE